MTDRELMQRALAALDGYARNCKCEGGGAPCDAAEALRARLAQPEQEPVAWMYQHEDTGLTMCVVVQQVGSGFDKNNPRWQKIAPLYTAPPKILCGCGDQIMPDDGAECGNCVAARNA